MIKAMAKSTSGETMPDMGIIRRGKYTFVMILAFYTILVVERVSPSAKSVHGMRAAKLKRGYGIPSEGIFASLKEQREYYHKGERLDNCPEKTKCGLFVPDLHISCDKIIDQFPVFPELVKIYRDPFLRWADFY